MTVASVLGSACVPVKVAPPSFETLIRMSLLQAPASLHAGVEVLAVDCEKPSGVQPFDSFESLLMYEPNVTTTCCGFFGFTLPTG